MPERLATRNSFQNLRKVESNKFGGQELGRPSPESYIGGALLFTESVNPSRAKMV